MKKNKIKDIGILTEKITEIIKSSPISDKIQAVYIFGSYAKGEQTEKSDLDILVTLTAPTSGFDFLGLEYELTNKMKMKIDLVPDDAISPYLKNEIDNSKKLVYER